MDVSPVLVVDLQCRKRLSQKSVHTPHARPHTTGTTRRIQSWRFPFRLFPYALAYPSHRDMPPFLWPAVVALGVEAEEDAGYEE